MNKLIGKMWGNVEWCFILFWGGGGGGDDKFVKE